MSISISDTWAAKTIAAYKDAARQAGQVLKWPFDFPSDAVSQFEQLQKLQGISKDIETIITSMGRQLVRTKDKNNKIVNKEYLTIRGEFTATNYRGVPYAREFLAGKHDRANVVVNTMQRYDNETGNALLPEKILSGHSTVFTIELPKDPKKRKQTIDGFGDNNDPNSIQFYYNELGVGNYEQKSDDSFSYEEFVNLSIEELKKLSAKSGGGRSPGYWRDNQGKLHGRDE